MRQVAFAGGPPPTSDVQSFLEWVRERLTDIELASAEGIIHPEDVEAKAATTYVDSELATEAAARAAADSAEAIARAAADAAIIAGLPDYAATVDAFLATTTVLGAQQALSLEPSVNVEPFGSSALSSQTASYTLVLADKGKIVEVSNASANNLTIPPNSSVAFPVGTRIDVVQMGAGQTSLVPGAGVTLRSFTSYVKLRGQYAGITLYKRGTNEWVALGNLVP